MKTLMQIPCIILYDSYNAFLPGFSCNDRSASCIQHFCIRGILKGLIRTKIRFAKDKFDHQFCYNGIGILTLFSFLISAATVRNIDTFAFTAFSFPAFIPLAHEHFLNCRMLDSICHVCLVLGFFTNWHATTCDASLCAAQLGRKLCQNKKAKTSSLRYYNP